MAYDFPTGDSASNNSNISAASTPITTHPATIVAWINPDKNATNGMSWLVLADSANDNVFNAFLGSIAGGQNNVSRGYVEAGNSGNVFEFLPETQNSIGEWRHQAVVFTSSTSRTVYREGVASTSINTTTRNTSGLSLLRIGAPNNSLDGKIAEFAMWNVALTAAEIASLAKGFSPRKVRPQSLKFYAPLRRDLSDLSANLSLTNNTNCAAAQHPRLYA